MTEDDLCLSIDLGTGGPKIGLVTLDGEVLAHEVHHVPTVFRSDGAAIQDAELWWSLVREATKRLLHGEGVVASRVRAVAVTGQYASTVPVDANGLPTGPCLTWLDTRGATHSRRAVGGPVQGYNPRKALRFIRKSAGAPSTSGRDPVGQILYLVAEEPDLVARTRWFMEPVDYLTMRFTGVASATHASRLALWMTDTRRLSHYDYDPALLATIGLSGDRLPCSARDTPDGDLGGRHRDRLGRHGTLCHALGAVDLFVDKLPSRPQKDGRTSLHCHRSGTYQRFLPGDQQPGDRCPSPGMAAGGSLGHGKAREPSRDDRPRRYVTTGGQRRNLHALAHRGTLPGG